MIYRDALEVLRAGGKVARNHWEAGRFLSMTRDRAGEEVHYTNRDFHEEYTPQGNDEVADDWCSVGATDPLAKPETPVSAAALDETVSAEAAEGPDIAEEHEQPSVIE